MKKDQYRLKMTPCRSEIGRMRVRVGRDVSCVMQVGQYENSRGEKLGLREVIGEKTHASSSKNGW